MHVYATCQHAWLSYYKFTKNIVTAVKSWSARPPAAPMQTNSLLCWHWGWQTGRQVAPPPPHGTSGKRSECGDRISPENFLAVFRSNYGSTIYMSIYLAPRDRSRDRQRINDGRTDVGDQRISVIRWTSNKSPIHDINVKNCRFITMC